MNVFLIIVAAVLMLVGFVGAIVPGIAGPPFSFLGLLAVSFIDGSSYSTEFLVIMGVIGAVVFALDYIVPAWGTKQLGGSKAGVRGSTIGLVLSLLFTLVFPVGFLAVLLGPSSVRILARNRWVPRTTRHGRRLSALLSVSCLGRA